MTITERRFYWCDDCHEQHEESTISPEEGCPICSGVLILSMILVERVA